MPEWANAIKQGLHIQIFRITILIITQLQDNNSNLNNILYEQKN